MKTLNRFAQQLVAQHGALVKRGVLELLLHLNRTRTAHLTLQTEFVHVVVNPATGEVSRIPRSWAYSSLDENEFAEMAKQIRDYLLGDFLDLCIERGNWDDNTVLHFQTVADR